MLFINTHFRYKDIYKLKVNIFHANGNQKRVRLSIHPSHKTD